MGIISTIILGALIGWIASKIMGTDASMGALANIVVGIVGSGIGSFLAGALLDIDVVKGFNITNIIISLIGACILLFIVGKIKGKR